MRSFTAEELERSTGFDRRTIAYYVQEGLLPKVGRRGPRTRYPKLVLDRLLFIRRVREAEESGEIAAISLNEMRIIFESISPELVTQVAEKKESVACAISGNPQPAGRSAQSRREAPKGTWSSSKSAPSNESRPSEVFEASFAPLESRSAEFLDLDYAALASSYARASTMREAPYQLETQSPSDGTDTDLGNALCALQDRAGRRRQRDTGTLDRWSQVEISPDITLSVRGITDEDSPLLEIVGKHLRRLLAGKNRKE